MADIGARIRQRREKLGWTIQKLATLAEVNNGYLSRVERNLVGYSQVTMLRIAGALGLSEESLYASNSNVAEAPPDTKRIPVLDYVQAGRWMSVRDGDGEESVQETITTNLDCPPSTFALRIRGDSMSPEFRDNDIVIIAPTIAPRPGDCVVATDVNGDATFKRYRDAGLNEQGKHVFELVPDNTIYAPMRSDRQPIAIVGTMIEHRRYRRNSNTS